MNNRSNSRRQLLLFAALSLAFHALILLALTNTLLEDFDKNDVTSPEAVAVEMRRISEKNSQEAETLADILKNKQVVENKQANDLRPKDPSFASEKSSRAQTQSRPAKRSRPAEQMSRTSQGEEQPAPLAPLLPLAPNTRPRPTDIEGPVVVRKQPPPTPSTIQLQPSRTVMGNAISQSGLEHLEDVEEGDRLALNSIAFAHAGFFNRIKQQVQQHWHPDKAFEKNDPNAEKSGTRTRTTELLVVLNPDGSLRSAYVRKPSGASFLDDEAWNAVQQGAPFPNVPLALQGEKDNLIKFSFQFIVEVGRSPVFRMRRFD